MRKLKKKYICPKCHLVVTNDFSLKRKMYKDISAHDLSTVKGSDVGVSQKVQLVVAIQ